MNSLFENLTETLTGKSRKKRDKFQVVSSSAEIPATILPPMTESSVTIQEVSSMANISYHPGSGKTDRAAYRLGKAFVPAAAITRIIAETEGKSEQRKAAILYSKLSKKYVDFLEAMDKIDLDYVAALNQMVSLKPEKKTGGTGQRQGKLEKTSTLLVKTICKRFKVEKSSPQEMVQKFLEVVNGAEFAKEAEDMISAHWKTHGTTKQGFIKTTDRVGSQKAIKALAAARAKKK